MSLDLLAVILAIFAAVVSLYAALLARRIDLQELAEEQNGVGDDLLPLERDLPHEGSWQRNLGAREIGS